MPFVDPSCRAGLNEKLPSRAQRKLRHTRPYAPTYIYFHVSTGRYLNLPIVNVLQFHQGDLPQFAQLFK